MSRIGRKPIQVPVGVKVAIDGQTVKAEGPKGKLGHAVPHNLKVELKDGSLVVSRTEDHRSVRALHGLTRALLANVIQGVSAGFEKKLEIVGIGYRAQLQGKNLQLALGYSHPVIFPLPEGIQVEVDRQVVITLRGADKALVGQVAANARSLRPPEPYKGKGIKYAGETIRRKVGKKGAK